ncbi:MAG: hypothetical protein JW892_06405 [Anaerolineae bacterium]|nr:hypothetical protein [Anaerolineae bacterium]
MFNRPCVEWDHAGAKSHARALRVQSCRVRILSCCRSVRLFVAGVAVPDQLYDAFFGVRGIVIAGQFSGMVVDHPRLLVALEAIQERFHAVSSGEGGKGADAHFVEHRPGAREVRAFPAAVQVSGAAAFEVGARLAIRAAIIAATHAVRSFAAQGAGESTKGNPFLTIHDQIPVDQGVFLSTSGR